MLQVGACVICGEGMYKCKCKPEDVAGYKQAVQEGRAREQAIAAAKEKVLEAARAWGKKKLKFVDGAAMPLLSAVRELDALEVKP